MLFKTILDEMIRGNFSFAILVVGILQLIVMLINMKNSKKTYRQYIREEKIIKKPYEFKNKTDWIKRSK